LVDANLGWHTTDVSTKVDTYQSGGEELDAAREAGLQTRLIDRLIDRLDDYPLPRTGQAANGHERVENFQQIQL
jgi:methionine salvage enolase-phosphatase E1